MTSLVEEFYRLSKAPFSFQPGCGPVLMTESLRATAGFLRDGLRNHAPILCVSGPTGIGKSSLARALPKIVGDDFAIARLSGDVEDWKEIGPVLASAFRVDAHRISRGDLEAARERVGKPLIVVDDAQNLCANLLERICILPQLRTSRGEPVVQVILLADLEGRPPEEIRLLLAWVKADARHVMQPIPAGDTHRFLDTCLRRAGWEGQPLVCEAGAGAIHRFALGNPRHITESCAEVLEQAAVRGLKMIDAEFVVECLRPSRSPSRAEPLGVAPGTPLCEEPSGDDADGKDAFPFATHPLTAENINQAKSLQLEDEALEAEYKAVGYPSVGAMSALTGSTPRARASIPRGQRQEHSTLRPKLRTRRRSGIRAFAFAALAALLFYSARTEVAELLQEFGSFFSFSERAVGTDGAPETLLDALSMGTVPPDATEITVPVPNESTDRAFATLRAESVVDGTAFASN